MCYVHIPLNLERHSFKRVEKGVRPKITLSEKSYSLKSTTSYLPHWLGFVELSDLRSKFCGALWRFLNGDFLNRFNQKPGRLHCLFHSLACFNQSMYKTLNFKFQLPNYPALIIVSSSMEASPSSDLYSLISSFIIPNIC